jgi:HTH-type transcriptional repressor of NAD biosynthesis genes
MIRGLVIGKFWPPHRGHEALIEFARARCEQLHIIVCHGPRYDIPGNLRRDWLQQMFPDAHVIVVQEVHADDDPKGWAEKTKEVLGFTPDKVFTSEADGIPYATWLGCEHVSFDPQKQIVKISSKQIRANPLAYWDFLNPTVRAHFVKRVALIGAESCGKSTLANALAATFKTWVVPEYGRFYWDGKQFSGDDPFWTTEEFVHIAMRQNECEDYFATRANKVLICDTNAFLTGIWHRRYLGFYAPEVDAHSAGRHYDLVLYFPANIPFVQDGTRDGELIRPEMSEWILERLQEQGIPFHMMEGSVKERVALACKLIKQLLHSAKTSFSSVP